MTQPCSLLVGELGSKREDRGRLTNASPEGKTRLGEAGRTSFTTVPCWPEAGGHAGGRGLSLRLSPSLPSCGAALQKGAWKTTNISPIERNLNLSLKRNVVKIQW